MKILSVIALLLFASPLFAAPVDDYLKQGNIFMVSGKFEKAAKSFGRAVECDPQNAEAHKGLGMGEANGT